MIAIRSTRLSLSFLAVALIVAAVAIIAVIVARPIVAIAVATAPATIAATVTIAAAIVIAVAFIVVPLGTLGTIIGRRVLARVHHFIVALIVLGFIIPIAPLIVEARATFAQHAEIMVGELEIIFGLHAVAGELRIARHRLVLFKQLSGVAPLPVILPIAGLTAAAAANALASPLPTPTAPAATLTIVDQMPTSLRSDLKSLRLGRAGLRKMARL